MELPVNYDKIPQKQRRIVREEYIRVQEGNCQHCGESLDGDPSGQVVATGFSER